MVELGDSGVMGVVAGQVQHQQPHKQQETVAAPDTSHAPSPPASSVQRQQQMPSGDVGASRSDYNSSALTSSLQQQQHAVTGRLACGVVNTWALEGVTPIVYTPSRSSDTSKGMGVEATATVSVSLQHGASVGMVRPRTRSIKEKRLVWDHFAGTMPLAVTEEEESVREGPDSRSSNNSSSNNSSSNNKMRFDGI